jgi:hypothetical protein
MPILSKKRGLEVWDNFDAERSFAFQKSFMANPSSPMLKERSLFHGYDDGLLAEERSTSKPRI